MTDKTPGQVAYEAYWTRISESRRRTGMSYQKKAWEAAAQAAMDMQKDAVQRWIDVIKMQVDFVSEGMVPRQHLEALAEKWRQDRQDYITKAVGIHDDIGHAMLMGLAAKCAGCADDLERVLKGGE